jgi:hypothetical protein
VATRLHDMGHTTVDIDICPSKREDDDLERLGEARRSIDLFFEPAGFTDGYESRSY